jgi:hypothetical protein
MWDDADCNKITRFGWLKKECMLMYASNFWTNLVVVCMRFMMTYWIKEIKLQIIVAISHAGYTADLCIGNKSYFIPLFSVLLLTTFT